MREIQKSKMGKLKSWVGGGEMEMDADISSDFRLLSQILVEKWYTKQKPSWRSLFFKIFKILPKLLLLLLLLQVQKCSRLMTTSSSTNKQSGASRKLDHHHHHHHNHHHQLKLCEIWIFLLSLITGLFYQIWLMMVGLIKQWIRITYEALWNDELFL